MTNDPEVLDLPEGLGAPRQISQSIYALLRRHIEKRTFPDGLVLGEAAIAKALDIGRGPARTALEQLAADWLVLRFGGRGLIVSYTGRPVAPVRKDLYEAGLELSQSDRDAFGLSGASDRIYPQVEATISSCVAFGRFAIDRLAMAEHHHISPTLAHVILTRLETVGLVRQDKLRWYADKLTPDQISEYYEIRQLMEPEALKRAYPLLDRNRVIAARDRLKAVMARGDVSPAELNQVERDIHIDIVHACPNVQMVRIIRDSQRSLITTMHTFERYGSTPKMVLAFEEHLAVLEAIVAGDPDGAADALRQHLIRAQASTVPRMIDLPPLDKDRYPPYLLPVESA
ncbi:FCD domain-containing protein [Devosia sp. D6-9]|nr:FCD domain-containing protein [Devosia sp. D6-9]